MVDRNVRMQVRVYWRTQALSQSNRVLVTCKSYDKFFEVCGLTYLAAFCDIKEEEEEEENENAFKKESFVIVVSLLFFFSFFLLFDNKSSKILKIFTAILHTSWHSNMIDWDSHLLYSSHSLAFVRFLLLLNKH